MAVFDKQKKGDDKLTCFFFQFYEVWRGERREGGGGVMWNMNFSRNKRYSYYLVRLILTQLGIALLIYLIYNFVAVIIDELTN